MLRHVASISRILGSAAVWLFLLAPDRSADAGPQPPTGSHESLAIIVNQSNPVTNFSLTELRATFLGGRSHWSNGPRITLVMMEPGRPEREVVLREIYRMSEADFHRYFLRGLFTGEVLVSPKTLATPAGVRKFVFNVPGAIGYLRPSDLDGSIKVVRVDGHLPSDAEYRLQIPARSER